MQKLFSSLAATSLAASLALAFPVHAASNLPVVQEAPLRAHLAFLSDDLLEGRGTGQRGADLTVAYLESQARLIGLQPLRGNSFRQSVQIAGVKSLPQDSSLQAVASDGKAVPLAFGPDWVWATGDSVAAHTFDAPLVFAGYGVTAPEEGWNDFKGVDVKGKIIVVMVNDPQPTEAEPNRFAGKALTYYGRWTYKFEEAKRQGAAGVLADPHQTVGIVRLERGAEQLERQRAFSTGRPHCRHAAARLDHGRRGAAPVCGRRPGPRRLARESRKQGFPGGRPERQTDGRNEVQPCARSSNSISPAWCRARMPS